MRWNIFLSIKMQPGGCPFDSKYTIGVGPTQCLPFKCPPATDWDDVFKRYESGAPGSNPCDPGFHPAGLPIANYKCSPTSFCAGVNLAGSVLENWCAPNQPVMPSVTDPNSTTLKCCLNQIDPVTGGPNRTPACAAGYCPNGARCGEAMTAYCHSKGYDSNCRAYLTLTTNNSNKNQIVQDLLNQHYPPNQPVSKNQFNKTAVELCNSFATPGTCDPILTDRCKTYQSRDDLTQDPDSTVIELCGCHLPTPAYDKYKGIIPKECDPICLYPNAIKEGLATCTENNCIVDFVNYGVIKGGVTISQACGGKENYRCLVSKAVYDEIDPSKVQLESACSSCATFDPADPLKTITVVPCRKGGGGKPGVNIWLIVGIIAAVIILITIVVITIRSRPKLR